MNPVSAPFIRPYGTNDLGSVIAILRSNIPKYFFPTEEEELRVYLSQHSDDYFVLELGGEIVGAGGIALNSDGTISLCWGMVRNDLIGTGLGKRMALYRMDMARLKWGDRSFFTSTSHHTEGFYKKLGFKTFEHTPNGFGPGIDICKMRLEPINQWDRRVSPESPV